eukprot:2507-Amphidinium_carterae.1
MRQAMPVVADLMELLQEASVAMTSGKTHLPNDHACLAKDGQFVHFLTQAATCAPHEHAVSDQSIAQTHTHIL